MRLEGLGKFKKSNDLIGTRIRDLPACSIVPQPTTLPRVCPPERKERREKSQFLSGIMSGLSNRSVVTLPAELS
jgi:hypothetical protein